MVEAYVVILNIFCFPFFIARLLISTEVLFGCYMAGAHYHHQLKLLPNMLN